MTKYLMLWPNTATVRHINYHITMFGEVADYIETVFHDEFEYLDIDALNWDSAKLIKHIIHYDLKGVVMFVSNGNFSSSIKLAKLLKEMYSNIKILAYGHLTAQLPNAFLDNGFDAIHTSGDPETAIESFFKYSNNDISISKLCGIDLILNNRFIKTEPGQYLPVEKWGFARLEKLPFEKYYEIKPKNRIIVNITRGCHFACPHCLVNLTQGSLERRRDLNQLKEYLYTVKDKYSHIKLWAANFTLDKQYVYDFCAMKNEYFPEMTFECATRVNLLDDIDMLSVMAKSGCKQITVGIESINQEELNNIYKNYDSQILPTVIENVHKVGINIKGCIMLNLPGQTKQNLINTLDFLTQMDVDIRATIYTPYQEMNEELSVEAIERFNRRTYYSCRDEITFNQYLQLEYDIYNYKEILK